MATTLNADTTNGLVITPDTSGEIEFQEDGVKVLRFSQGGIELPTGTTAERPSNPRSGQMRFNTTDQKTEIYDGTEWKPAGGAEGIELTSVSPTTFNGASGTTFTVQGANFGAGTVAYFIDNANNRYAASTTSVDSSTQISITTPQAFSISQEPLSIQVLGSNGVGAVLNDVIDCGSTPTWITSAGNLGNFVEGELINITVSATDPDTNSTLTYSLGSGSLPSGITLSSDGVLSGSLPAITSPTTYSFTITATDNGGNTANRQFNIVVTSTSVSWTTASGSLGEINQGRVESKTVVATTDGTGLSYSLVSGTLPTGYSVNSSTGVISGNASGLGDYTSATRSFTIRATNAQGKYADRAFSIVQWSRYRGYICKTGGEGSSLTSTAPTGTYINRIDFSAYGQPNGSCPNFTYGGCNSSASNNWAPALPATSVTFVANNGTWGDPCGGTTKRGYTKVSYGGW